MKKLIRQLIIAFIIINTAVFAQWEKVNSDNVGATGQIGVHGSTVFIYGYNGGQFVMRSSDNGATWTNIASKFPDKVYFVYGHGDYVFAVVGIGQIYYSADEGLTWSKKSSLPLAISVLTSDGSILYAASNRSIIYKSIDNGSTWSEITISYSAAQVLGFDFAAVGNKMVLSAIGLGALISNDGGTTWEVKNPSLTIGTIETHKGEIFGSTYGMYKLVNNDWVSSANGFPNGIGVTGSTKSTVSVGNKMFTYYSDVITQSSNVFVSEDNGGSWKIAGSNFPQPITSSLNNFLVATPEYLYCYVYSIFTPASIGTYRLKIETASDVEPANDQISTNFSLEQNYPNPFNPSTKINFSISKSGFTTLKVYNLLGEQVADIINANLNSGSYTFNFDASHLTSGIYFYTLNNNNNSITKKMMLAK